MEAITFLTALFSVLVPTKMWYAPNQPLTIDVKAGTEVSLVLTDFSGKPFDPKSDIVVATDKQVDLKPMYQQLRTPGTYLLFAVPKDKQLSEFVGTPLVISVRMDQRRDAPTDPMVIRVAPLQFAAMTTDQGEMTLIFWYDVAPNTVDCFLNLSREGYYDGLTFHRIVPGFVLQGGDPKGDGTGGPGYTINEEFNSRQHVEGVLSMARSGDPLEAQGAMPRYEAANSAGSQFFVCLDYTNTKHLDNRYTAFGKVTAGMETAKKIAAVELADERTGRPKNPPVIQSVKVKPVTAAENPYADLLGFRKN